MAGFGSMGSRDPWSSGNSFGGGGGFQEAFENKQQIRRDLADSTMASDAAQTNYYNQMSKKIGMGNQFQSPVPGAGYDLNNTMHAQLNRHANSLTKPEQAQTPNPDPNAGVQVTPATPPQTQTASYSPYDMNNTAFGMFG